MQYKTLGRTGLKVSPLCLGTMKFGPQVNEEGSFAIMDKALDEGINFFDTANVYGAKKGEGVTEQIVGRWLAQGGHRNRIVLATTCYGEMGDGPNDQLNGALHALDVELSEDTRKKLDAIWPGPGGEAPMAYAW